MPFGQLIWLLVKRCQLLELQQPPQPTGAICIKSPTPPQSPNTRTQLHVLVAVFCPNMSSAAGYITMFLPHAIKPSRRSVSIISFQGCALSRSPHIDLIGLSIRICLMKSSSVLHCATLFKRAQKRNVVANSPSGDSFLCDAVEFPCGAEWAQGVRKLCKVNTSFITR